MMLTADEIHRLQLAAPGRPGQLNMAWFGVLMAALSALLVLRARMGGPLSVDEPWMAAPCAALAAVCWKLRHVPLAHYVGQFALAAALWFVSSIGVEGRVDSLVLEMVSLALAVIALVAAFALRHRVNRGSRQTSDR